MSSDMCTGLKVPICTAAYSDMVSLPTRFFLSYNLHRYFVIYRCRNTGQWLFVDYETFEAAGNSPWDSAIDR